VHLVGFTTEMYYDAWSYKCQKRKYVVSNALFGTVVI